MIAIIIKKVSSYFSALIILTLTSCSAEKAQNQQTDVLSSEPKTTEAVHASHAHAPEVAAQKSDKEGPLMTENGLPKELVCMVNNAYMGKKQFPVEFQDKMYYGCCEMCVDRIKNDEKIRVAVDPLTGKEVDKSKAFIALEPGSDSDVLYFDSEENYTKYLNQ